MLAASLLAFTLLLAGCASTSQENGEPVEGDVEYETTITKYTTHTNLSIRIYQETSARDRVPFDGSATYYLISYDKTRHGSANASIEYQQNLTFTEDDFIPYELRTGGDWHELRWVINLSRTPFNHEDSFAHKVCVLSPSGEPLYFLEPDVAKVTACHESQKDETQYCTDERGVKKEC